MPTITWRVWHVGPRPLCPLHQKTVHVGEAKGEKGTAAPQQACKAPAVRETAALSASGGGEGWAHWGVGMFLSCPLTALPSWEHQPAPTSAFQPQRHRHQSTENSNQNHPPEGGRDPASAQQSRGHAGALLRVPQRSSHAAPRGRERTSGVGSVLGENTRLCAHVGGGNHAENTREEGEPDLQGELRGLRSEERGRGSLGSPARLRGRAPRNASGVVRVGDREGASKGKTR